MDEFGVWLKNHPAIFTEDEDELVHLTGKVPLLLSVFERVYGDGDFLGNVSWCSVPSKKTLCMIGWCCSRNSMKKLTGSRCRKVFTLSVDWLVEWILCHE